MKETHSMEIEMPDFMSLVDAEERKKIIKEVEDKIRGRVSEMFLQTAREIISQKLNLYTSQQTEEPAESDTQTVKEVVEEIPEKAKETIKETNLEIKTALAEKLLSLSPEEALQTLKMSLAEGKIDEKAYNELKSLVTPPAPKAPSTLGTTASNTCPQCGKKIEPTANFCRFCGAHL